MFLTDLTFQEVLLRGAAFLIVIAVHGFALAGIARLLGDKGPQFDARLTVSPLAHLDVLGLLGAIVFRLGWIKPIAIDPAELRTGRRGLVIAVLLSLGAVLAVAALLMPLRPLVVSLLPLTLGQNIVLVIENILEQATWFVAFNVLPLPLVTGAHLVVAIRPEWREFLPRLYPYAVGVLAVLMVTGLMQRVIGPAADFLAGRITVL